MSPNLVLLKCPCAISGSWHCKQKLKKNEFPFVSIRAWACVDTCAAIANCLPFAPVSAQDSCSPTICTRPALACVFCFHLHSHAHQKDTSSSARSSLNCLISCARSSTNTPQQTVHPHLHATNILCPTSRCIPRHGCTLECSCTPQHGSHTNAPHPGQTEALNR